MLCHQVRCRSVFYSSAGVKANFKYKKLKNSQRFNSKLTAFSLLLKRWLFSSFLYLKLALTPAEQ